MAGKSLAALSTTLDEARERMVAAYVKQARAMWNMLAPSDWWNDGMTFGVAARAALLEIALIQQVRQLGVQYADETLRMLGVKPSGNVASLVFPRANADPWLVAARPADSYRGAAVKAPSLRPVEWPSKTDESFAEVDKWLRQAFTRLETAVQEDTLRASTTATIGRYKGSRVDQYRRVLHPELSKTGSCGLCVVAADRWYSTRDLLPIHANCHCGIAPAGADYDPGYQLNQKDLQRLYKAAGGTRADLLKQVKVMGVNHGELGPILSEYEADRHQNGVPAKDAEQWHVPDRQTTLKQIERMENRAIEFNRRYKEVRDTGKDVSFRYEGRKYTFSPSKHLNQAMAWQRTMLNQMRALQRKAA